MTIVTHGSTADGEICSNLCDSCDDEEDENAQECLEDREVNICSFRLKDSGPEI